MKRILWILASVAALSIVLGAAYVVTNGIGKVVQVDTPASGGATDKDIITVYYPMSAYFPGIADPEVARKVREFEMKEYKINHNPVRLFSAAEVRQKGRSKVVLKTSSGKTFEIYLFSPNEYYNKEENAFAGSYYLVSIRDNATPKAFYLWSDAYKPDEIASEMIKTTVEPLTGETLLISSFPAGSSNVSSRLYRVDEQGEIHAVLFVNPRDSGDFSEYWTRSLGDQTVMRRLDDESTAWCGFIPGGTSTCAAFRYNGKHFLKTKTWVESSSEPLVVSGQMMFEDELYESLLTYLVNGGHCSEIGSCTWMRFEGAEVGQKVFQFRVGYWRDGIEREKGFFLTSLGDGKYRVGY